MNYIVLEGISLYMFFILIILLIIITIVSLICVILSDRSNFMLKGLLLKSNERLKLIAKENFILKIRCGDLNLDEK